MEQPKPERSQPVRRQAVEPEPKHQGAADLAALALLAAATPAPAAELSESGGDRTTNDGDNCVLGAAASAIAGVAYRDVPAGAYGCQIFDGMHRPVTGIGRGRRRRGRRHATARRPAERSST
jgi:hypothetical protein